MDLNAISGIVARHVAAKEITGGVTLVAQHGRVVLLDAQGVADHDSAMPLVHDSVFGVMSMTKPVTAAAAAILVGEGKLRTDDPVSRYIPEFAAPRLVRTLKPGHAHRPFRAPPNLALDAQTPEPEFDYAPLNRALTVHDIMSFTSGLQTIGIENRTLPVTQPEDTLASYVAKLGEAHLEFQPGSRWHYSNSTGYEVLARIVEVASGVDFPKFVQERLFEPLGMNEASFGAQAWIGRRLVPLGPLMGPRSSRTDYASGSAGLFTTAENYWRFAQMLLNEGSFEGRRIMARQAVAMMRTNQIGNLPFPGVRSIEYTARDPVPMPGMRYGYGVAIVKNQATSGVDLPSGSFGWDGIGSRRFWVIPELDTVVIMLMAGIGEAADPTHREIERSIADATQA